MSSLLPLYPLLHEGRNVVGSVWGEELKCLTEEGQAHRAWRKLPIASWIPPVVDPTKEADNNKGHNADSPHFSCYR